MNALVGVLDAISLVGFTVALVMALTTKTDSPLITKSVRYVFAGAMGLYVLVGISNVLEHTGLTAYFDMYEDYLELLFMPAIAWTASTLFLNTQVENQRRLARAMRSQNDLLLNIVDTVPGGIIVLDVAGGITFTNEGAERILGLRYEDGGSTRVTPEWTLRNAMSGEAVELRDIANAGTIVRRSLIAEWPDHRSTTLVLSATPMNGRDGQLEGSVVAFEDITGH